MSLKERHQASMSKVDTATVAAGGGRGRLEDSGDDAAGRERPRDVVAQEVQAQLDYRGVEPAGEDELNEAFVLKRNSVEYVLTWLYPLGLAGLAFKLGLAATQKLHEKVGYIYHMRTPWMFKGMSSGVDQTDGQWRQFHDNIGLLGPAFVVLALLGRLVRQTSVGLLPLYYIATGLAFGFYLQGMRTFFMLGLQLANYFFIAKLHTVVPFKVYMFIMWTSHVGILFINDKYDGYSFSMVHQSLGKLDNIQLGMLRWNIVFNMSTLRMIAFNYDLWEARFQGAETRERVEKKHRATCVDCITSGAPCYKMRTDSPHAVDQYNIITYFSYLLYVPLFIGGPMSSFNAFVSHMQRPQQTFDFRRGLVYAARIVIIFLVLSFMLHFVHLNAIRDHPEMFGSLSISEKVGLMYLTLAFLWLKFSAIWKFFRLIALIDGIEAPEDMNRCFNNTVTVQSFWRDWHASFNAWIVRYMYVPMGGSRFRVLSIFPIFGFIALWHDITLNLFMWALVMCIAFVPEIVVTAYFYTPRFKHFRVQWYWRYVRAAGALVGITGLAAANLVGFGVGTQNTSEGMTSVMTKENAVIALSVLGFFFTSATIGIRDRDMQAIEQRRLQRAFGLATKSKRVAAL